MYSNQKTIQENIDLVNSPINNVITQHILCLKLHPQLELKTPLSIDIYEDNHQNRQRDLYGRYGDSESTLLWSEGM